MAEAPRDQNHIPAVLLESSTTPGVVLTAKGDPVTGRLLVDMAGGTGGDMVLASVQTVTGLKTFDTTKLAVKGSSTGSTAIASANASATDYTITLAAATGTVALGTGTANEIAYWSATNILGTLAVVTYPSLTEISYVKGVTSAIQTQIGTKAPTTAPTFATSITGSYLTASEMLITGASKEIISAPVATYPSLTELSYVKGLSSAVQTQLGTKAPSASPTFTGTTIQSGNVDLDLPASDHTATGLTTNTILSGATVAAFELVYLGTGGKWLLVDSDAVATCKGMIGIALEAKNDTQAMLVALPGSFVRDDTWAWTIGATLYAGETPGTMQEAIPTGADAIIKVVGFAVSADVIFFNPSPDQQSTVA